MNNQDELRHKYLMNRRTFVGMVAAGAAIPLLQGTAAAQSAPKARNVVLVHGLFADGSCWSEVIARLQAKGIRATAVQNPLTTLADSVAATQRALAMQDGPTVLVGHSFAGMIITEAGIDPKVSALVYVAARAPDAGEDYTALAKQYPTPPASAGIVWSGDEGQLSEEAFLRDFAGDLPAERVCRVHRRPDHQSRSRAVHGQADGSKDGRGESEPSFPDIAARHHHEPDPRGRRIDPGDRLIFPVLVIFGPQARSRSRCR
jgi:pimeloyl-ACP methyl ester carboxylesterase